MDSKTNIIRIFIVPLVLVLMIVACISTPSQSPEKLTPVLSEVIETSTPARDGMSIRLTERVGTVIALKTASVTPLPTRSTPTPEPSLTTTPFNLSDLTSVAEATQNPLFEKYCKVYSYHYFFDSEWGLCDNDDKTFAVFSIDGRMWQFSYVIIGLAHTDEGSEYYTRAIYLTKDKTYAYFAPSPRNYDPLGPFYGDGIALLRVDLTNGQIQTILSDINRYYSISFAPTGRRMAFAALNFDKKPLDLVIQDLQSGETRHFELDQKYDQAGEFVWSSDGLKLAYKLLIDGDECSRKFAIRLLNFDGMSSNTIIPDMQINTCQQPDPTFYIDTVTKDTVILEQHGEIWVYDIAAQRLSLQATATPGS
jgi:hypothetical protein